MSNEICPLVDVYMAQFYEKVLLHVMISLASSLSATFSVFSSCHVHAMYMYKVVWYKQCIAHKSVNIRFLLHKCMYYVAISVAITDLVLTLDFGLYIDYS